MTISPVVRLPENFPGFSEFFLLLCVLVKLHNLYHYHCNHHSHNHHDHHHQLLAASAQIIMVATSRVDQLNLWKNQQEALPLLVFLVRVVFCNSSGKQQERGSLFSCRQYCPKRVSPAPENVESSVIENLNASLLRDMGFRK